MAKKVESLFIILALVQMAVGETETPVGVSVGVTDTSNDTSTEVVSDNSQTGGDVNNTGVTHSPLVNISGTDNTTMSSNGSVIIDAVPTQPVQNITKAGTDEGSRVEATLNPLPQLTGSTTSPSLPTSSTPQPKIISQTPIMVSVTDIISPTAAYTDTTTMILATAGSETSVASTVYPGYIDLSSPNQNNSMLYNDTQTISLGIMPSMTIDTPSSSLTVLSTESMLILESSSSMIEPSSTVSIPDSSVIVLEVTVNPMEPSTPEPENTTSVLESSSSPESTTPFPTSSMAIEPTLSYNESAMESSSEINPSPTITIPATSVMLENTTSEPSPTQTPEMYGLKVRFVLSGNCSVLRQLEAADNLTDFSHQLRKALAERLNLEPNQFQLEDTQCGARIVVVHLLNLTADMGVEGKLEGMENQGELFRTSDGNDTYGFVLLSSVIIEAPTSTTTTSRPDIVIDRTKLTSVQIIVIIVCTVVGGMLLMFAFGFCIYGCIQRKKTKSFDLGMTPANIMHMEDFTLTKLQRPQSMYTDYGPVAVHSGMNGKTKRNGHAHYEPIRDEMAQLTPDDVHLTDTLPQRSSIEMRIETENIPPGVTTRGTAGFDNPSFSSDDILDSGADTDQELPLDPEPGRGNSGYQPDDVVVSSRNTNGHLKTEAATSF